jgi:hypothetical protein
VEDRERALLTFAEGVGARDIDLLMFV